MQLSTYMHLLGLTIIIPQEWQHNYTLIWNISYIGSCYFMDYEKLHNMLFNNCDDIMCW